MGGPGSGRRKGSGSHPEYSRNAYTVYKKFRGTAPGLKRSSARYYAKQARSQALNNRMVKKYYPKTFKHASKI